ncbi:uncharacterized protein LOC134802032 isoform X2 [Cydia splendana]|uniref:uncharacterized protein LOC134802032 isoform X2 n=1 Tax=Cydia splendana TaxID=1100963 RepID=UPI0028F4AA5A
MLKHVKFLRRLTPYVTQRATFQNFVMSDSLAQLDSECEKCCYNPRVPPRKVAIIGAGTDVGQIVSLFLKQQRVIKTLALYENEPDRSVLGVATDLAHIDTSPEIEAYQGKQFLKNALHDADVVLICGGCYELPPCCCELDRELFLKNMRFVRTTAIAVSQFCPYAILAVQTPPVDCNYALCAHTLKVLGTYNPRRVLGVNSINAMRANQLYASMMGDDPSKSSVAVVGGCGRCTRVPVFSTAKPNPFDCNVPKKTLNCLSRLVRDADDIICRVKSNNEQGHLSIGFSTGRFVLNIMKGMFETPTTLDSALVEQSDPEKCYGMPVCATPVTVGRFGVEQYTIPELSEDEQQLLTEAKCDLEDMLNLGRCYATGEEYTLHPCRYYYYDPRDCCGPPCPQVKSS